MDLIIKEEELKRYGFTAEQAKIEFALDMFQNQTWSGGQARRFLGLYVTEWQELLFDRDIDSHAGLEGFEQDMASLERRRALREANAKEKV